MVENRDDCTFFAERPEFVAIYGRRRVGKTYLVNQLFNGKMAFAITGVLNGTKEEQMEAFIDAMQEYSGKLPEKPKTWMEAFRILKLYLKKKVTLKRRCIVFLDELPSMDTQRSGFVRALGYFWNSWASLQDNLTLIVCGSATSWMIRNIVNDKGGLHDRITHELHLHPFIQVAGIVYDHRQNSGKSQGRNVARRIEKGFGAGFKRIAQRKT